ncbi:MAG: hypothetical protein QW667_07740 [Candidatus Bathyarchaeia archaeon]
MPPIAPSHLYTIIALMAVSTLLTSSFTAYTSTLRFSSEINSLKDLVSHVAAKCTELLTLTLATNATVEAYLQLPSTVGNLQYWIQFNNDSEMLWVEGGFGEKPTAYSEIRVYAPSGAFASGYYVGGFGKAYIKCRMGANVPEILLSNSGGA